MVSASYMTGNENDVSLSRSSLEQCAYQEGGVLHGAWRISLVAYGPLGSGSN